MTRGVSVMAASPTASTMSDNPPPDVAVIARAPACDAPIAIKIAVISSSHCLTTTPSFRPWEASHSVIEVAGVIGYIEIQRQPAAAAPYAMAWLPLMSMRGLLG